MRFDAQSSMNWTRHGIAFRCGRLAAGNGRQVLAPSGSIVADFAAACSSLTSLTALGWFLGAYPTVTFPTRRFGPGARGRAQEGREGQQPQATLGHGYRLVIRKHRLESNSKRGHNLWTAWEWRGYKGLPVAKTCLVTPPRPTAMTSGRLHRPTSPGISLTFKDAPCSPCLVSPRRSPFPDVSPP